MPDTSAEASKRHTADLTNRDRQYFEQRGIALTTVEQQLARLRTATQPVDVVDVATVGHGIERWNANQRSSLAELWRSRQEPSIKFVPASGAATRMFAEVLALQGKPSSEALRTATARRLLDPEGEWPFALPETTSQHNPPAVLSAIIEHLVGTTGLNLQARPKGLLPFHRIAKRVTTAFEEQLREGFGYLNHHGTCAYHFTVSAEHREAFVEELERLRGPLQQEYDLDPHVEFSTQDPRTDTVAIHRDGGLFRDSAGTPHLRAGGHGALLSNLEAAVPAGTACVFIKNIDNVLPHDQQAEVVAWKQALAGRLLEVREQSFAHLAALRGREGAELTNAARAAANFWTRHFGVGAPTGSQADTSAEHWIDRLDRPIRVCGMVRNQGQPGGGPFWVGSSQPTLQIVEAAELHAEQRGHLERATHFNPVDIAASITSPDGSVYPLQRFVDSNRVFVAAKSHLSEPLLALELPGLWNGAMAHWNTMFVEVPVETFAPVKTVFDLLDPAHQPETSSQPQ